MNLEEFNHLVERLQAAGRYLESWQVWSLHRASSVRCGRRCVHLKFMFPVNIIGLSNSRITGITFYTYHVIVFSVIKSLSPLSSRGVKRLRSEQQCNHGQSASMSSQIFTKQTNSHRLPSNIKYTYKRKQAKYLKSQKQCCF